jgi:hypothetical protein
MQDAILYQAAVASYSQVECVVRWTEGWVWRTYSNIVRIHVTYMSNPDRSFGPSDPFRSIFFLRHRLLLNRGESLVKATISQRQYQYQNPRKIT